MSSVICKILFTTALLSLVACDRGSSEAGQEFAAEETGESMTGGKALVGKLDISERGSPMIDAWFTSPDGTRVSLNDFKGRPLLVNIWATWCGPCIIEMPMLDKLAVREKDRLKVMVVSQDIKGMEKVGPFFEKSGFDVLEPYIDQENELSFGFSTGVMPTTVLYDAQGKEVWRVIGAMDWHGAKAAALMEETLSGG